MHIMYVRCTWTTALFKKLVIHIFAILQKNSTKHRQRNTLTLALTLKSQSKQVGNLAGHSWVTKLKLMGHGWGKKLLRQTWGIVGAKTSGSHLGQSRQK